MWILENVFETLKNRVKAQVSDIGQGEPVFPRNFRHVSTSRRAFVFRPGADASRALLGRSSGASWARARGALVGALLGRSSGAPGARAGAALWGAPGALFRRFQGAFGYHAGLGVSRGCRVDGPLCFIRAHEKISKNNRKLMSSTS